MRTPIAITGLGTVNAAGCGRAATAAALAEGARPWSEIDRSEGFHRPGGARLAGLTAGHDLSAWVKGGAARRMSLPSKLAVAAARMALAEAGIEPGEELGGRPAAMVFSNPFGPSRFTERILAQIEGTGPLTVSPALFTESVANAPAAQVAIACRAVGANITVTQREAGALIALGCGARELGRGRAGYVLVVTVDEVTPLLHAVLDRYRALARTRDRRPRASEETARPFDRQRSGFLLAEGATALVVERAETAAARGARVLARWRGGARAFDPRAPVAGWGRRPEAFATALGRLLEGVGEVDAVICGANGSRAGDRLEAGLLKRVWGSQPLPALLAPKAVLGEFGGAQPAAAVLALEGEPFAPTPGFSQVDRSLGVAPWAGGTPAPRRVLVSSLATGGAGAWAVLERG